MKYTIKEIFGPTIQGEGTSIGLPVMFLRFAGCNRWSGREEDKKASICSFCDTDFVGGDKLTSQEIISRLDAINNGCKDLVLSGGEPMLQIKEELVIALRRAGYKLHLETNGSTPLGKLYTFFSHITLSPKQSFEKTRLEAADDLKILYPWISKDITPEKFEQFDYGKLYLQPVYGFDVRKMFNVLIKYRAKLSPQLHKLLDVL